MKAEQVTAIAAVVISVVAVFVAADEARIMRKQQHASVYPHIAIFNTLTREDGRAELAVAMKNVSVGPAFVEAAEITYDGERVAAVDDLVDQYFAPLPGANLEWDGTPRPGLALAPNSEVTLARIVWRTADIVSAKAFWPTVGRMDFSVCYCSIYERCWWTTLNQAERPIATDSCERRLEREPKKVDAWLELQRGERQ